MIVLIWGRAVSTTGDRESACSSNRFTIERPRWTCATGSSDSKTVPVGPGRTFVFVRDSIPVSIAMSHGWPIPLMSHIDGGPSSLGARRPK